jgi:alpha-galactosidase
MKFELSLKTNLFQLSALSVCFLMASADVKAQNITIPIETRSNALVLQADAKKNLSTIYLGKKLSGVAEYEQIPSVYKQASEYTSVLSSPYTSSGSKSLLEPAISVSHADGNNSLDLRYVSHKVTKIDGDVSLTTVVLKDPVYDFEVTLYYKTYFKDDVVEQWSVIKHKEKGNVLLQKYASANLYLKAGAYWLTQYHGDWAKEMRPEESRITHGIKTLDTKLGTRANLFQPSVFMVSLDKPATEDEGTVLYGALEYSGNFRTDIELDYLDNLKIISGINNYASAYTLKPNEEFTTPAFLYTLSSTGKGNASRNLHNWARNYKILDGKGQRLTLLNNWEATYFDFNETKLFELLKDTKKLGVDMFLLDDGWFANKYPRNGDVAGLGDWEEKQNQTAQWCGFTCKRSSGQWCEVRDLDRAGNGEP